MIEGLTEAIERQERVRNQAFLDVPQKVCGIEVGPLTVRRYLLLSESGSPFIRGGIVEGYDIAAFFIVMTGSNRGLARWLLLRRVGALAADEAVEAIKEHIDEQLIDRPAGGSGESYYSFAAALVDFFVTEYDWTQERVMDTPLSQAFQLISAATKRHNPKAILFNPSDKVKGQWLADVNAGRIQLQN